MLQKSRRAWLGDHEVLEECGIFKCNSPILNAKHHAVLINPEWCWKIEWGIHLHDARRNHGHCGSHTARRQCAGVNVVDQRRVKGHRLLVKSGVVGTEHQPAIGLRTQKASSWQCSNKVEIPVVHIQSANICLLYTSPSPR